MTTNIFILIILLFLLYTATFILIPPNNRKRMAVFVIICLLLIIALAVYSYFLVPGKTTDLYRHFYTIEQIKNRGFSTETGVDSLPLVKVLMLLAASLDNPHLLPAIVVTAFYSITFYIILYFYRRGNFGGAGLFFSFLSLFALCNYFYIATTIKTSLAFSLFILGVFLTNYRKRRGGIIFILLSLLCHGMMYMVVPLYFICKHIKYKNRKILFAITILSPLVIIGLAKIQPIFSTETVKYLSEKILFYYDGNTIAKNIAVVLSEFLLCAFFIRLLVTRKNGFLDSFTVCILLIGASTIIISDTFLERFLMLFSMFIPFVLASDEKDKKSIGTKKYLPLLCALELVCLFYYFAILFNHTEFIFSDFLLL